MDFTLIERHPWETVAIIGVGGLILFLVIRGRGGNNAGESSAPASGGYAGVDPAVLAAQNQSAAQTAQINAQLQAVGIQSSTQLGLAQIQAGPNYSVAKAADVQNTQTNAELLLGLGAQNAQVEMMRIQAGVQQTYINALLAAFGGTTSPGVQQAPPVQSPIIGSTKPTPLPMVTIQVGTGSGGYQPGGSGTNTNNGVVPEGVQLVPNPAYAYCDPRDVACVNRNQSSDVNWVNGTLSANNANNRAQCLANAEQSKGYPNYAALVAACG